MSDVSQAQGTPRLDRETALAVLEVAVVGNRGEQRRSLQAEALAATSPGVVVAVGEPAGEDALVPLLAHREAADDGGPLAYVCREFACRLPAASAEALREQLAGGS